MSVLKIHKVIANLPSQLEPNAIYVVRVGTGFRLYVSDATGNIAHIFDLPEGSVTETKLADNAVTNSKIADGAVTDRKISGRLSLSKLPTSSTANRALVVTTANSDPQYGLITEDFLSLSDRTTWDVTTTRHGFCPKLSGNSQHFLRGDGTWAIPPQGFRFSYWFVLNPIHQGTWYIPYAATAGDLTIIPLQPQRTIYIPFIPLIDCTITHLAIEITTGASGTASIGIYNTVNHRPHMLLGAVTNINTAVLGPRTGSVSVSLIAGQLYWLALFTSAAINVRGIIPHHIFPLLGIILGNMSAWTSHYFQDSFGLPNPANPTSQGGGGVPAIYVRYNSS